MTSPTAGCWSRSRRWRWRRASAPSSRPPPIAAHAFWFGEDQARYVITADPGKAARILDRAKAAGVPAREIGTTGGDALAVAGERAIPIAKLRERFEGWLPAFMAGAHP